MKFNIFIKKLNEKDINKEDLFDKDILNPLNKCKKILEEYSKKEEIEGIIIPDDVEMKKDKRKITTIFSFKKTVDSNQLQKIIDNRYSNEDIVIQESKKRVELKINSLPIRDIGKKIIEKKHY